jgi:hypothetical protein
LVPSPPTATTTAAPATGAASQFSGVTGALGEADLEVEALALEALGDLAAMGLKAPQRGTGGRAGIDDEDEAVVAQGNPPGGGQAGCGPHPTARQLRGRLRRADTIHAAEATLAAGNVCSRPGRRVHARNRAV